MLQGGKCCSFSWWTEFPNEVGHSTHDPAFCVSRFITVIPFPRSRFDLLVEFIFPGEFWMRLKFFFRKLTYSLTQTFFKSRFSITTSISSTLHNTQLIGTPFLTSFQISNKIERKNSRIFNTSKFKFSSIMRKK